MASLDTPNENNTTAPTSVPLAGGGAAFRGGGGGGGGRRDRGDGRRRDERGRGDGEAVFEEIVVKVNRCAKVMKGGRRFSFSALVIVGNRNGKVGYGFGKARAVPNAVEKGVKDAKKSLYTIARIGTTIPHAVDATFEASRIRLIPAAPGTGIVAGSTVRAIMALAGLNDILTKSQGQTNAINLVKATFKGLERLRTKAQVAELRGVSL